MTSEPLDSPSFAHWKTLAEAFRAYRFPIENLAFAQRMMDEVGIDFYEAPPSQSRYFKAIRMDGGAPLRVEYGFTSGFTSEQEASTVAEAAGNARPARSKEGAWYIPHPTNAIGKWYGAADGGGNTNQSREGSCSACGYWNAVGSFCDAMERPHAVGDLTA